MTHATIARDEPYTPDDPRRWSVCLHEAGHTVVACAYGVRVSEVYVSHDGDSGHCKHDIPLDPVTHGAIGYAGWAAQQRAGCEDMSISDTDKAGLVEAAKSYLATAAPEAASADVFATVARTIAQDIVQEFWPCVTVLAHDLYERGRLTMIDVENVTDPRMTPGPRGEAPAAKSPRPVRPVTRPGSPKHINRIAALDGAPEVVHRRMVIHYLAPTPPPVKHVNCVIRY